MYNASQPILVARELARAPHCALRALRLCVAARLGLPEQPCNSPANACNAQAQAADAQAKHADPQAKHHVPQAKNDDFRAKAASPGADGNDFRAKSTAFRRFCHILKELSKWWNKKNPAESPGVHDSKCTAKTPRDAKRDAFLAIHSAPADLIFYVSLFKRHRIR